MNAAEAEATGQQYLTATYQGHEYKLAVDTESWPLEMIFASVGVNQDKKLVVNYGVLAAALAQVLGSQWGDFITAFPLRRDLLPASKVFADAAGFKGRAGDLSFGALPRLLATFVHWGDAVEATLATMGLDYGDRWRFDADGRRRLTLRQIHVRLLYAPRTSPLAVAQNGGRAPHSATDLLLMDLFEAITKIPHPSRPLSPKQLAERLEAKKKTTVAQAVESYHERHGGKSRKQQALDIARQNAQPGKAAHANQAQEDQH